MNCELPEFKLDLEKAQEPKIKLATSAGSSKRRESSREISSALSTMPKPLTVGITTNCGKFWEMGIPDHLTCLLRNLYAGQEATVRTRHGKIDWFHIRKGVCQGYILSPWLFNLYAGYFMQNEGWMKQKVESRLQGELTSDMQMTPLMAESGGTKEPLDESQRGEWKMWLKTQHSEN